MKCTIDIKSVVLGALLGAILVFSVAATATSGSASRGVYEYRIIPSDLFQGEMTKVVNGVVAEGWDFVSASPLGDHWGFAVLRREKK